MIMGNICFLFKVFLGELVIRERQEDGILNEKQTPRPLIWPSMSHYNFYRSPNHVSS